MLFCLGRLETSIGSSSQDSQGVLRISKHLKKQSMISWLIELSFNISTKKKLTRPHRGMETINQVFSV
jgi:hypothetical protein